MVDRGWVFKLPAEVEVTGGDLTVLTIGGDAIFRNFGMVYIARDADEGRAFKSVAGIVLNGC